MSAQFYHRNTCRLCEGRDLSLVLKLTPCPPVDAYVPASRLQEVQEAFPLDLFLCHNCGHTQLLDVVSPKLLFGSYIYTTASSPGLVEYFRTYADEVIDYAQPAPGSTVADIGSNDGTLLGFFKKRGLRVLGIDPAQNIAEAATASDIETVPSFFTGELGRKLRAERGPFSLVTANNVFAHSDQLGDMAAGVHAMLSQEGLFVFEVSYMLDMVKNMVFDFIYHEHLSHHSAKPLQLFLRRHGLELLHVQRTPSKGGSLRCFAQLENGPRKASPSVDAILNLENEFGLYDLETYKIYAANIEKAKSDLNRALTPFKSTGNKIAGYGASATGTVLIYHFDLGDSLSCIIDDNPLRQNLFSPGHHIPVLSPKALYNDKPDAVVILAWRFADMIIKKHESYLKNGGKFIVPLPTLTITGG
ncbi:MAG: class I SAM-dependent methyltransferase [Methylacidiphilales bacterium]|nr:class I SAM-dependent methyltransferase [Candidatus Methylacidiphilales bacterium]